MSLKNCLAKGLIAYLDEKKRKGFKFGLPGQAPLAFSELTGKPNARALVKNAGILRVILKTVPDKRPPISWLSAAIKQCDDYYEQSCSQATTERQSCFYSVQQGGPLVDLVTCLRNLTRRSSRSRNKVLQELKSMVRFSTKKRNDARSALPAYPEASESNDEDEDEDSESCSDFDEGSR